MHEKRKHAFDPIIFNKQWKPATVRRKIKTKTM